MRIKVIVLLLITSIFTLSADSVKIQELKKEKEQTLNEIKFLDGEIKKTQKVLGQNLNNVTIVNEKLKAQRNLLKILAEEIKEMDNNIRVKELRIRDLEKDFKSKQDKYAVSVRKMYRNKDSQNHLLFVLSADDFAQSLRRLFYLKKYSGWQKTQAYEIVAQQQIIQAEKSALESDKVQKQNISQQRKTEEEQLQKEEVEIQKEISHLQKNSKQLQADLAKKKKQADALDKEIDRVIQAEIEASRKEAAAKPGLRQAATKDGYAMTKEEQKLAADFASNKGKLPFPLQGRYTLIGRFGQQNYVGLPHIKYNKNGIEIRTTQGNSARAVFNGVVTKVFQIPGSQTSVIIRHGNYLTLYSYLESVSVKQGDKVTTGQVIGKIYDDVEKGTTLYFEMRRDKAKIDPEPWLNK
ncbi:MAG: peptidoglycan DD-metalloendopeptidase family protein [Bacteroidales bacterium]|nr:peptidoglycan DD-metalloendopeptidase family protein [Bacteroidales bacterium]